MKTSTYIASPYGFKVLEIVDTAHQRYTKRGADCRLYAEVVFNKAENARWIQIKLEEMTTDKNGRISSKVIILTLPQEHADKLREYLS